MRVDRRFIRFSILAGIVVVSQYGGTQQPQTTAPAARPLVFVAVYERGEAWDDSKGALQQSGIEAHMQYLRANIERLIAAAPFRQGLEAGSQDRTVGMVITLASSQEDAERLIAADPAIAGKLMRATVRRWMVDRVRAH